MDTQLPRRQGKGGVTTTRRRLNLVAATGALAASGGAGAARAQAAYPSRPVRMLVGSTPGGSGDIGARLLAARLSERLGQPCVVENKPGAAGALAAAEVARAEPDGQTLLFTASWHSTAAAIKATLPYDSLADFTFVSTLTTYGMVLAVRPEAPFGRLEDLVAAARARPGTLSFYSVGIGSAHHLIGEWLNAATGAELVHVPYRGSSVALPDFLSGRIDLMVETMTVALALARSGEARPLAVTARERLAELPEVRLTSEIVPGFAYESWLGLLGPPGMPPPLLGRLNREVGEIVALPDVAARLRELGAVPRASTPEAFRRRVAEEIAQFGRIVEARNIPRQ